MSRRARRQLGGAPTTKELRAALRWFLDELGISTGYANGDGRGSYTDGGCGCCANYSAPPASVKRTLDHVWKQIDRQRAKERKPDAG